MEIGIYNVAGRLVHHAALNSPPMTVAPGGTFCEYPWRGAKASGVYFAVVQGAQTDGSRIKAKFKIAVIR